jgi:hypothetical protein
MSRPVESTPVIGAKEFAAAELRWMATRLRVQADERRATPGAFLEGAGMFDAALLCEQRAAVLEKKPRKTRR